jgi:hypothetical protein
MNGDFESTAEQFRLRSPTEDACLFPLLFRR